MILNTTALCITRSRIAEATTVNLDDLLTRPIPTGRAAMLAHRDQLVAAVAHLDAARIDDLESRIDET